MIADEGYTEGDQWLYSLAKEARRRGTPVVLDNGPELFSESYPMIPRFPPSPACAKTREPNAFRSAAMDPLLGDWIPGRSRMIRPNF